MLLGFSAHSIYDEPGSPDPRRGEKTMPLLTVEGVYKDGKVELTERPAHVADSARVLVTFLSAHGERETPVADQSLEREALRQQAFRRMKQGIHFGGPPYPRREELYDRFDR
jgi:hypothetical protein